VSAQQTEATVYTAIPSLARGTRATSIIGCSLCGNGFEVKARTLRLMKQEGRPPVCRDCRCHARSRDIVVTPATRRWAARTLAAMSEMDREVVAFGLGATQIAPRADLALAASGQRRSAA
jgi:hypothetical protein